MAKTESKYFRAGVVQNILASMSRKDAIRLCKIGSDRLTRWLRWHHNNGGLSTKIRGR